MCAAAYLAWLGQPCHEAARQGARLDHDPVLVDNSPLHDCSECADNLRSVAAVEGVRRAGCGKGMGRFVDVLSSSSVEGSRVEPATTDLQRDLHVAVARLNDVLCLRRRCV